MNASPDTPPLSGMSFSETEEHRMLRDSVGRFFAQELPEMRIREMDRARVIPKALWKRVAELGWMGLSVPVEYGGSGADVMTTAVLCEEVAQRFPSMANDLVVFTMGARVVREHGTEAQRAKLLPLMARGEFSLAFGITEPRGGTDALGLTTRAVLEEDGWRLNGQKLYTTFADDADAILVVCRTDPADGGKRARGVSLIMAPRRQSGFDIRRLQLMGHRAACTCEVFLDDVRAPADALLGERGRGFYALLATLDEERILAAALLIGIMAGVFNQTLSHARDREAFGRPIGAFQAVQHPIADMATDLELARLITMKAAWMLSMNLECSKEAAMAKLFAAEAAIRTTDRGMRVLAAHGLVEESPMERLFRDARLGPFSPISNEMSRNFIAERLGLPRSY
jgi:acyl-CoA dehydrogenase